MTEVKGKALFDVSVVIPAWNAAHFIERSVQSALTQEGVSLEVIVVNDGSTDETGAVVRGIFDTRVRYIHQEQNLGPAAARNIGFAAALGRWIAVLDADDLFLPERLSQIVKAGAAEAADIVADNLWSEDAVTGKSYLLIDELPVDTYRFINLIQFVDNNLWFKESRMAWGHLKPVFRRDFLLEHSLCYRTELRIGEDFHFVLEALACGAKYILGGTAGYSYQRHRPGSISYRLRPMDVEIMIAADKSFLSSYGNRLTSHEHLAMRRHLNSLYDAIAFVSMIEAIKRLSPLRFLAIALKRPRSIRLFALRNFRQPLAKLMQISKRRGSR